MIQSRYLLLVWGTLKGMKSIFAIAIMSFLNISAFAQGAADKNVIDLSGKMDTIAREHLGMNDDPWGQLNVQLQNDDNWEDIEILGRGTSTNAAFLRFGGPLLFDSIDNPKIDLWLTLDSYKDIDGDGIGDLSDLKGKKWFKGNKENPYFYETSVAIFKITGFPGTG